MKKKQVDTLKALDKEFKKIASKGLMSKWSGWEWVGAGKQSTPVKVPPVPVTLMQVAVFRKVLEALKDPDYKKLRGNQLKAAYITGYLSAGVRLK